MNPDQKPISNGINNLKRHLVDAEAALNILAALKPQENNEDNVAAQLTHARQAVQQAKASLNQLTQSLPVAKRPTEKGDQAIDGNNLESPNQRQRLLAMMEALPLGVAILDAQGGNIQGNRVFEQIWGNPLPDVEGVNGYSAYKAWWLDTGKIVLPEEWAAAQAVQKGKTITGQVLKIQRFDGTFTYVLNNAAPIFDQQGQVIGCAVAIQDISELKQRQDEVQQLNRTLKALSNSNHALLHAFSESEFLQEVCRIIIEDCGCAMVWIGFVMDDERQSVVPVASAGFEHGYLEGLNISLADPERGSGPTGTAIRTRKPTRCNDMLTDPKFTPWREAARQHGYASSIVLPLIAGDQIYGALNIYSREPAGFSEAEETLLVELAGDLAYGIGYFRLKTASARAAEQLRESEERYRSLFDNMTEGFALHELVFDKRGQPADYRFLEVNASFEDMTGLEHSQIIGHLASQVLPGLEPFWLQTFSNVVQTGLPVQFDHYTETLGRHFRVYAYRPAPGQFASIFMDVTEAREVRQQLTLASEKYSTMFNTTTDGIWIQNMEGMILEVNDAYCAMSGYSRKELTGMPVSILEANENPAEIASHIQKILHQAGHDRFESRHKRKDGTLFDVAITALYMESEGGRIAGFVRDVTEQKRLEAEQRQNEARRQVVEAMQAERQRFYDVLETMPVMICLLTADYHVAYANRAFRITFGESEGRYCYEYCYGQKEPCDFCESFDVLKSGQSHHWEVNTADGKVIDIHDVPFTDLDGTPMILEMDMDITERRKSEQELAQYRQHLEELVADRTASLEAANARLSYLATFPEDNPRPIVEIDKDGEVSYANPAAMSLFPDLITSGLSHPWLSNWDAVTTQFRTGQIESIIRDISIGEKYYQQAINYMEPQGLVRIYGLDITGRKLADLALRRARDELEQRVQERTQELNIANFQLRAEVQERQKAQAELGASLQELQVIEEELRKNNELLVQAQAGLETERRRYLDLFEFAPDAYLVTDTKGVILQSNQYAEQLLAISRRYLISKPMVVFINRADHAVFETLLQTVSKQQAIMTQELRLTSRRGAEITVALRAVYAKNRDKQDTIRWTIRDVSELKKSEEIIRRNALRNAVLSEVSQSLAAATMDEKAVLDVVVRTTANLVGDGCVITLLSPDGQSLQPVAWHHRKPEALALMDPLVSTVSLPVKTTHAGRQFQVSDSLLIKDYSLNGTQERILPTQQKYMDTVGITSLLVVPIQIDRKVIGTLGITRDRDGQSYTEDDQSMLEILANRTGQAIHNARLYQELQAALSKELEIHDQLVQAEKFAAVGRLLASITHEINNPLQTIKNCLYLSQVDTQPGTPVYDALAIATTETNRLSDLVAQLRELYRPPTLGISKPVSLPTLINEVHVLLVSYLQDKNIRWEVTLPQDKRFSRLKVEGVPDQLKQVFLNICLNAIDAMESQGGSLLVDFKVNPNMGEVGVSFQDTGPGLPPEVKAKLFEPFTTTKEKGLGLGLTICYDIIQKHKGHIDVVSDPGEGAQFTIWLPTRRK